MFSLTTCVDRRRRVYPLAASTLFLALAAVTSHAQVGAIDSDPSQAIGTRATARNTVHGFITSPEGARVNRRVKVRIAGATGGSLFTMTDDNGSFIFQRLAGGTYFLTVDAGGEFERVTEVVDVFDPGRGRGATQMVQVQLRYKATARSRPEAVSAALAGVPKAALKQYEKALKAAASGDSEKAVKALKSAIELHPDFMLAHSELGVQYTRLNRLDEAAEALRAALRLAPGDFTSLVNYGILLFHQRDFAGSAAQLRLALKERSRHAKAHFYLGRALIKLGELQEAEAELRRAVEIGGAEVNEGYRYLGGVYVEMGDNARAVEALEKYLSLMPAAKDADAVRQIVAQLRARAAADKK
jgi:predicted Zn-dependent protease